MVAPLLTHISWHFWHIRTVSSWAEIRSSNSKQKACLSSQQTWNNMNSDKKSLEDGWFSSEKWWNILTKHGLPSLIGGISLISLVCNSSFSEAVCQRACLFVRLCVCKASVVGVADKKGQYSMKGATFLLGKMLCFNFYKLRCFQRLRTKW